MKHLTVKTVWRIGTYDVWGNARDGYEVNDVYRGGEVVLTLRVKVNNPGTNYEFKSAYPTNRQLKRVFGTRCHIDVDGDDIIIYVNRRRDGYPIGELQCVSHSALSPIKEKEN